MAKQNGLIKVKGSLDGLTFYETKDGHIVRKKNLERSAKVKTDARYERVRENNAEFGAAVKSASYLRRAIMGFGKIAIPQATVRKLNKLMFALKDLDGTSARGMRLAANGLLVPVGKIALRDFVFDSKVGLDAMVLRPLSVNTSTGEISMSGFKPSEDLSVPVEATHVRLKSAWLKLDLTSGLYELQESATTTLIVGAQAANLSLVPVAVPSAVGADLHLLHVRFYQEVNGQQYALGGSRREWVGIVEVQ